MWPAFWTVGPTWPNNGEIDIIEYANKASSVVTTLHTNNGCNGTWGTMNCDSNVPGQNYNAGYKIRGSGPVGATFNEVEYTEQNGIIINIFALDIFLVITYLQIFEVKL